MILARANCFAWQEGPTEGPACCFLNEKAGMLRQGENAYVD